MKFDYCMNPLPKPNPYKEFDQQDCEVTFVDFGKEIIEKGRLLCNGHKAMIQINSWVIGVGNVRSVKPITEK